MIGAYEAKRENRATIMDKIAKLTGEEPWSGYDEQTVDAITTALAGADAETARKVLTYERDHKERAGVIDHRQAPERQLAPARRSGGGAPLGERVQREPGGRDDESHDRHRRLEPQQQRPRSRARSAPATRSSPSSRPSRASARAQPAAKRLPLLSMGS